VETGLDRLRRDPRERGNLLVALSGGVDSSFLVRVAAEELGGRVIALTTLSPTGTEDDAVSAARLTKDLGVRHVVIAHNELEIPGYAANPTDRCYLCKGGLYDICRAQADRLGISHVADGVNADDLSDYRPGLTAAAEHGILHPLADARLTKAEVREHSRRLGLPDWERPASPCLSSRFPYGTPITLEGLRKVGGAECVLRELGFRECRVRYHDPVARIEVPAAEMPRLLDEEVRATVLRRIEDLGFLYVTVDLRGYRTGSLNEVLAGSKPPTPPSADPPAS